MNPKDLLLQIGSVTLAAMSLLSASPGDGAVSRAVRGAAEAVAARREQDGQQQGKKLILAPASRTVMIARGHRSHSSHRSHRSHASHYSGSGGGYRSPRSPSSGGSYSTPGGSYNAPTPSPRTPARIYRTPARRTAPPVQVSPDTTVIPGADGETAGTVTRSGPAPGRRLRGMKLARWELSDSDYANADAVGTDFTGATLIRADFEGADLTGANFTDALLDGANLKSAKLVKAKLKNAHLHGTNLCWTDFSEADLEGADLTHALYNKYTRWPKGFDPKTRGMHLLPSD